MAVLVEGISVIVRIDRLRLYFEDWETFAATVPNKTLCYDKDLARVGFMDPAGVQRYVVQLERRGLRYLVEGEACDLVVADQLRGLLAPSDWALFGRVDIDGDPRRRVGACMMDGGDPHILITPDGWDYPGSLSDSFGFVSDNGLSLMKREIDANDCEFWESPLASTQFHTDRTPAAGEREGERQALSQGMLSGTWGQA
jgi:hypothetical protein